MITHKVVKWDIASRKAGRGNNPDLLSGHEFRGPMPPRPPRPVGARFLSDAARVSTWLCNTFAEAQDLAAALGGGVRIVPLNPATGMPERIG